MKIAILDANTLGDDLDLSVFRDFGEVEIYGFTLADKVIERIADVNVIITNKVILDENILKYAKSLELICLTGTGTNNVDKTYTNSRDIKVCNVLNYSTESVAQHTFALLFYLYEKLDFYNKYVKGGQYINDSQFTHFSTKFNELKNKTWGIIGLGNIGKRVAEIARAFGCQVIYYSTSGKNNCKLYQRMDLTNLLKTSDIISIHAPLNDNTDDLINYESLSLMKQTAILLNLGRGKIINEKDLVKALKDNQIAGAGIDVLEVEPMTERSPYIDFNDSTRLLITPHIGWASVEARNKVINEVYKNIEAHKNGVERCIVHG